MEKSLLLKEIKNNGGDLIYDNYEKIEKDFISKKLHPLDLKNAVADEIDILLSGFKKNKKIMQNIVLKIDYAEQTMLNAFYMKLKNLKKNQCMTQKMKT